MSVKVLFPYPLEFTLSPVIHEYVSVLREHGFDTYYAGMSSRGRSVNRETEFPHIIHTSCRSKKGFFHFVNGVITSLSPDIVHALHYRGSGLLPLLNKSHDSKWIIDVRTVHVMNKRHKIDPFFPLKDRLTWLETQLYDHILALTPHIAHRLRPSLRPISLVPLGANWERLNPENRASIRKSVREELGISTEMPMLLYTGSLSPTRQIYKLILAFAEVLSKFPEARLVVIGGQRGVSKTSDQFLSALSQLALRKSIEDDIAFLGWKPYPEIAPYYMAADIGVSYTPLGTPYQYQPPTKLIEYMMAGMVAVSNRTPATEDMIEDNVNGILCGESVEQIAKGMCRALQCISGEQQHGTSMTSRAQRSVQSRDWRVIARNYLLPIYEQLLSENS